jgi:hypothetical protein
MERWLGEGKEKEENAHPLGLTTIIKPEPEKKNPPMKGQFTAQAKVRILGWVFRQAR